MKIIRPTAIDTDGSFSRASTATYFNIEKKMVTAAIDELRLQYDPSTGNFDGLVLEQEKTNHMLYSQDITQSSWVKTCAVALVTNVGPFDTAVYKLGVGG